MALYLIGLWSNEFHAGGSGPQVAFSSGLDALSRSLVTARAHVNAEYSTGAGS